MYVATKILQFVQYCGVLLGIEPQSMDFEWFRPCEDRSPNCSCNDNLTLPSSTSVGFYDKSDLMLKVAVILKGAQDVNWLSNFF